MREVTNVNKTGTLRATGAFSFIPEGRTYPPLVKQAVVSLPLVGFVRSPRGMRHLRMPMDNATVLRICCHRPRSRCTVIASSNSVALTDAIPPTARIKLPPGSFICGEGVSSADTLFSFAKRNRKSSYEGTVRTSGDLPSGCEGYKSRHRTICLCCGSIYELFADLQRL